MAPPPFFDDGKRAELKLLLIQGGFTNAQLTAHFGCCDKTLWKVKKSIDHHGMPEDMKRRKVLESENLRLRRWVKRIGADRAALRAQLVDLGVEPAA